MTNRWKFDILDDFAPIIENVELELGNSCEPMKSIVGPLKEVGIQILSLLWVLVMIWYLFDFMQKHENWKKWFLNENDFYKTKVVYLILKCLLNDWNFIKIILKPSFAN